MTNPVNIGVIGLGAAWETRYAPVLRKFRDRIHVRAVYDPLASRSEQVATLWSAAPMRGILSLLNRKDVRAVLLLDAAWHGPKTLEFACSHKKPVYAAGRLGCDVHRLQQLHECGVADGITLMPEMSRRYAPSSARLQELMATQLGRPQQIVINATRLSAGNDKLPGAERPANAANADCDFLVGLIDWCHYVVRTRILSVTLTRGPSSAANELALIIEFAPTRSEQTPVIAELRIHDESTGTMEAPGESRTRYDVRCQRGTAVIESTTEITWQTLAGPTTEVLTSDRADVEVMLDHFCRRVVGGLIPVADIGDVCRGLEVVRAARDSLQAGEAVSLKGAV